MSPTPSPFVVEAEAQLTEGAAVDLRPAWNADGRSIIFERQDEGRSRLFRLEPGRAGLEALDLCNEGATTVQGRPAFLGLDDFVFVSDRGGAPALWRCNLRQGTCEPVTPSAENHADYGPAALPNGSGRILFFSDRDEHGTSQLYEIGPDGNVSALTDAGGVNDQPWYVPRRNQFVYHSDRDGTDALYLQALTPGATPVRLSPDFTSEGTAYVTPYPSPDGEWIAFASAQDGLSQIWVAQHDGSRRQQLTHGETPASFPAWSPDGGALVFVRGTPTDEANPSGDLWMLRLTRTA